MYERMAEKLNEIFKEAPGRGPDFGKAIAHLIDSQNVGEEKMSIPRLSELTSLSQSYLYNVIKGVIKEPAYEKLRRVSDAFQIGYFDLLLQAFEASDGNFFTSDFAGKAIIDYPQHGFKIQSMTPPGAGTRDFFVGIMTVAPLKELKRWRFRDNSTIFVYVLLGKIEIAYGKTAREFVAGKSVYFDGAAEHRFKNLDNDEAKLFLVTRPSLH
jgi:quercetin dioxygenase-like cupin family protein